MGFKENLKAELMYNDMLVKELAARSGVNKRTIDNYLRKDGPVPSVDVALKIARVLDVSVEYLVTGYNTFHEKNKTILSPNLRSILKSLEDLDEVDCKIVFTLTKTCINALKERNSLKNTKLL
jgi:transcriptional regulator with XRE-family HTH domain